MNFMPPPGIEKPLALQSGQAAQSFIEGWCETLSTQSRQTLLILIWAHFAIAIFLSLEDSLHLTLIEVGSNHGLHGTVSFRGFGCVRLLIVS